MLPHAANNLVTQPSQPTLAPPQAPQANLNSAASPASTPVDGQAQLVAQPAAAQAQAAVPPIANPTLGVPEDDVPEFSIPVPKTTGASGCIRPGAKPVVVAHGRKWYHPKDIFGAQIKDLVERSWWMTDVNGFQIGPNFDPPLQPLTHLPAFLMSMPPAQLDKELELMDANLKRLGKPRTSKGDLLRFMESSFSFHASVLMIAVSCGMGRVTASTLLDMISARQESQDIGSMTC
jgi:hypothetical protein